MECDCSHNNFALGRPSSRGDGGPVEVRCAQALGISCLFIIEEAH